MPGEHVAALRRVGNRGRVVTRAPRRAMDRSQPVFRADFPIVISGVVMAKIFAKRPSVRDDTRCARRGRDWYQIFGARERERVGLRGVDAEPYVGMPEEVCGSRRRPRDASRGRTGRCPRRCCSSGPARSCDATPAAWTAIGTARLPVPVKRSGAKLSPRPCRAPPHLVARRRPRYRTCCSRGPTRRVEEIKYR